MPVRVYHTIKRYIVVLLLGPESSCPRGVDHLRRAERSARTVVVHRRPTHRTKLREQLLPHTVQHHQEMKKKRSERRKYCMLAVIRQSRKFSPRCRPLSRGQGTAKIYPVRWGSMHAILSYHGNRPTHTQTHTIQTGPITVHCAAKLSVQCNNALWPPIQENADEPVPAKIVVRLHRIWHCYSSHTSTRLFPATFGEKRRLQLSTCTLCIRSAFILGVRTWCLEQSASSAERHRCCLHLQASLKVWTVPVQ